MAMDSAGQSAKSFVHSSSRRRRTVRLRQRRRVRLPPSGRGKPAAATGTTDRDWRLVDRLVEAGPQRDRPTHDGRGVDPLLAEQDRSGKAANEPNSYRTEDVWLHRSSPNAYRRALDTVATLTNQCPRRAESG